MVRLAEASGQLGEVAGGGPIITEDGVAEAQRRLGAHGIPVEVMAVAAQLGRPAADRQA